jgi:hypothetical protein
LESFIHIYITKEEFWNWFKQNKGELENLILGKVKTYDAYEDLSEKLKKYSEYLIPELTKSKDGEFILVISCDGVKIGIPYVENLVSDFQKVDGWNVIKYRQPGPMQFIPINGLKLKRANIFLTWEKTNSGKYLATFYIKGYVENDNRYQIGTILHMDHTIGEYNAMTKIENVQFRKLGVFQSTKNLSTLDNLNEEIKAQNN